MGLPRAATAALATALLSAGCTSGAPCELERAWDADTGALTAPLADGDRIVVGAVGEVVAVGANDGVVRWRTAVTGAPVGVPVSGESGLWFATDRQVTLMDAETGEPRWQVVLDPPPTTSLALTRDAGFVAVEGGELVALSSTDGSELWRFAVGAPIVHPPGSDGERVVVSGRDGRVTCLDATDGSVVWDHSEDFGYLIATPVASDGLFLLTGYEDTVYVVDAATGERRWSQYAGNWIVSLPRLDDGVVYFGAAHGFMFAVELATGRTAWTNEGAVWGFQADLIVNDDSILVVGRDGQLVGVTRADGVLQWQVSAGFAIAGSTGALGRVVLRSGEDELLALEPPCP